MNKNSTEVSLNLSSNVIGNSNSEYNFLHKLLLTNAKVSRLRKGFANGSSAIIKSSKIQLHTIGQSRQFSGRFLEPLQKSGLPLMKNVLKTLVKNVLIQLGLTAAASLIQKKTFALGITTFIVLNLFRNLVY